MKAAIRVAPNAIVTIRTVSTGWKGMAHEPLYETVYSVWELGEQRSRLVCIRRHQKVRSKIKLAYEIYEEVAKWYGMNTK